MRLTHHEPSLVCSDKANLLWGDDLIGLLVLEHAVLVNAALMRKRVRAHNGLHTRHTTGGEFVIGVRALVEDQRPRVAVDTSLHTLTALALCLGHSLHPPISQKQSFGPYLLIPVNMGNIALFRRKEQEYCGSLHVSVTPGILPGPRGSLCTRER